MMKNAEAIHLAIEDLAGIEPGPMPGAHFRYTNPGPLVQITIYMH